MVDINQAGRFLSRQLSLKLPDVIKYKHPPYWAAAGQYIPSTGDLPLGTKTLTIDTIQEVGSAAIYDGLANDIPLADVTAGEDRYKAVVVISGFKHGVLELDLARRTGVNIQNERMMAMRRAIDERVHKLALFGSSKHAMKGFFNNSQVPSYVETFDFYATSTTADDLIDFLSKCVNRVTKLTKQTEVPNMMLCSTDFANRLNKRIPDAGNAVIDYFLNRRGQTIQQIVGVNELDSATLEQFGVMPAGTNKERIVMYPMSSEAVERKFTPLDTMPPQLHIMDYLTIGYSGTSEILWKAPSSAIYVDIPKAS